MTSLFKNIQAAVALGESPPRDLHHPRPATCHLPPATGQVPGPRRHLVSLQDIYPTVCTLAGLQAPGHIWRHDNSPLIASPTSPEVHPGLIMIYLEDNHCLRTPEYRLSLYKGGSSEPYQILKESGQHDNLAKSPEAAELVAKFTAAIKKQTTSGILSSE